MSVFTEQKIPLDGKPAEWESIQSNLLNENFHLSIQNDANYIYLLIRITSPEEINKALIQGMTIWFDAKGKKNKELGIHYPLGFFQKPLSDQKEENPPDFRAQNSDVDVNELILKTGENLEILRSDGKSVTSHKISDIIGLEIALASINDELIYELKIPCLDEFLMPVTVCPKKKNTVGLGIFVGSEKIHANTFSDRSPGDNLGKRGKPGMGEKGFPGIRNMNNKNCPDLPEITKLWCQFTLAD
ncbi:MAG: hypothetical protein JW784_05325 [Candidatus Cloacimonetes bacterium]|nr:hypothetical protein [Candidatus Cloacimonadota bacterium]